MRHSTALIAIVAVVALDGCIPWTSKSEGQAMLARIAALEAQVKENAKRTAEVQTQVDDRIKRMDDAVDKATLVLERNSADLGLTIEKVQTHVAQLDGKVDDLAHAHDALGRRFDDYRATSDTKLEQITNEVKAAEAPPIPDTADALYAEAEKRLGAQQWKDARRLLDAFVNRYPTDTRAPRAQFLMGDAYASEGRFANAIGVWTKLLDAHPPAEIEQDTMYKSGLAFYALKYCGDARIYFQELLRRHPQTKWKKDARQQLDDVSRARRDKARCTS